MRDSIRQVLQTLLDAGYEAYIVGGYVRDVLMGRSPGDCDVATNALPDEVESLFQRVVTVGKAHGTITVMLNGDSIEVTTYRMDGQYDNHRHPVSVTYTSSLSDDLARRDFTINAMAMTIDGSITDLFNGQSDLWQQRLRAIGEPSVRLQEDALRILRAIRFQSVLGMSIDPSLLLAMKQHAGLVATLSKERIVTELQKTLQGQYLEAALVTYHMLDFKALPRTLVLDPQLSVVEQFAIASMRDSFDSTNWPWRKDESTLLKQLVAMSSDIPDAVRLFRMTQVEAILRVGSHVYQWPFEACMARYQSLPIKDRKDLSIDGHDVVALGYQGSDVELILRRVEEAVLTEQLWNHRDSILAWIKETST